MKSKTKINISDEVIRQIFLTKDFGDVLAIKSLAAGEFNSVFCVEVEGGKKYVLKVAPSESAEVLNFEKNMMAWEVDAYDLVRKNTSMRVPEVFVFDNSKVIINADYFVMEYINAKTVDKAKLISRGGNLPLEKIKIKQHLAQFLGELHKIKGDGFGYPQVGLKENWYLAFKSMVEGLKADSEKKGKKVKEIDVLLGYIETHKTILEKVESVLVNFDLWENNVFSLPNKKLALIDPERSFWGDRVGDFVALEYLKPPAKKQYLLDAYNAVSDYKLIWDKETQVRYYLMTIYLGLIMKIERPYRYKKSQLKYWLHGLGAKMFLRQGLKQLKKI